MGMILDLPLPVGSIQSYRRVLTSLREMKALMANCSSLGAFDTWLSTSAVREVELMQSLYCAMVLTVPNLF